MRNIEITDIQDAYRKLKSYIYYDNYFIFLREKISAFEADTGFNENLKKLCFFINSVDLVENSKYFEGLISKITTTIVPKRYKEDELGEDFIITNRFTKEHYKIDSVNYLVDAPIEIHIISVLWILQEGKSLVDSYQKFNYAYNLEIDSVNNEVVDGLRLFRPYFEQYQKWRDNAIEKAQHFAKEETDVLIISLDVKKYFYNIDLNNSDPSLLNSIAKAKNVTSDKLKLTPLLLKIHEKYQKIVPIQKGIKKTSILPIGLLSSGIIGNWFLKDLDEEIIQNLSPAYYGRYVDDIVIVLANTSIPQEEKQPKQWVLKKFLTDKKIFKRNGLKKTGYSYSWRKDENIVIQKDKISIYAFDSKESNAVLNKFKKSIEKNSSAFWFLPEEEEVNDDFDENVYELTYSDTVNKLRSIQGIKQSKYGASVFLAKNIKLSILSPSKSDDKTSQQILDFFKGRMNLEFNAIWEKALTYFVINQQRNELWEFVQESLLSIEKMQFTSDYEFLERIKNSQVKFIENCLGLALALNPKVLSKSLIEQFDNSDFKRFSAYRVVDLTRVYRSTNMFRQYFVAQPLMNYTKEGSSYNYLGFDLANYSSASLDTEKFRYSPRYIYFHEFVHFNTFKQLHDKSFEGDKKESDTSVNISDLFLKEISKDTNHVENHILEKSFEEYYFANYTVRNSMLHNLLNHKSDKEKKTALYKKYVKAHESKNSSDIIYDSIEVGKGLKAKSKIRVAVANTIVKMANIKASMFAEPNLNIERRNQLIEILNQAEKCKADILVLPEVSIPYYWFPLIADEARRKQRVIIGGLEHIRINNIIYNLIMTCIPIERDGIKDVVTVLRLKNHYSPAETKLINDKGKTIPVPVPYTYNKFIWKKNHFSVYNCYELADIKHRSIFKSEVDMLFASEYNHDVNYFSNIAETISRDVHCFFIQVNTSDFGDSRITKPSKTESKDIMRLKGGKNSVVLYEELDLMDLREFQSTRISGQNTIKYKNTPPDYKHEEAEKRLNEK